MHGELTVLRRLLAVDEIVYWWFYSAVHFTKKKSYPWCLSCPVHYPLQPSNPLRKCCVSAFSVHFLSLFFLYCQLDLFQLDCGFGERIDAAQTPSKLAGLMLLLLSHLQSPLLVEKKKSACEGTSCLELAFNGCSESSLFNWLIKVGLDYIPCRKRDTEARFVFFFWASGSVNLGFRESQCMPATLRRLFCKVLPNIQPSIFFTA